MHLIINMILLLSLHVSDRLARRSSQVSQVLRQSEAKYRDLFAKAGDAIITGNAETGNVLEANRAAAEMLGYSVEELRRLTTDELLAPGVAEETKLGQQQQMEQNGQFILDTVWVRKDGSHFPVQVSGKPVEVVGQPVLQLICRDITERKRTEEQEEKARLALQAVIDSLPFGIFAVGHDRRIRFANPAAVALAGYDSESDLVGGVCNHTFCPAEDCKCPVYDLGQKVDRSERLIVKRGGARLSVLKSAVPMKISGEDVLLETVIDISESKAAEEALRQSEYKYSMLVERSNDGIVILQDGRVVFANARMAEITGFSLEQALGKPLVNYLAPESRPLALESYLKRLQGQETLSNYELVVLGSDGRRIPVEISASRIDYENKPADMAIVRDITERKKAEQRLAHITSVLRAIRNVNQLITHEKDRKRLIQRSCDMLVEGRGYDKAWIMIVDPQGNPEAVVGAGLEAGELEFLKQLRSGNWPLCLRDLQAQDKRFISYERPGSDHTGCVLSDNHRGRDVFRCKLEREGRLFGFLGVAGKTGIIHDEEEIGLLLEVCGDITFALASIEGEERHKRSEEQTRQLKEHLELQVERMPIGLIVWDRDFRVQSWNPAAEQMFGFTRDEALGRHPYDIIVPEEFQPNIDDVWNRLLDGDTTANSVNENTTKDGRTIYCKWSNTPLRNVDGVVTGVLSMVEDVTEREKMQQQLIMNDRLASVGELAAGIAHELNNPLTGVIAFADLLAERSDLPDEAREDVATVLGEAKRAAGVVKKMLSFARKHEAVKTLVGVNQIVDSVVQLRAYDLKLNNIDIETQLNPELPEISADFFQLQQVLINLVSNAEYAMLESHGRGKLTVITEPGTNSVRVLVADDGPGISQQHINKVFDPFFTTKPVGKGTGLGLSICYGIVSAHGGTIRVESQPEKGSTFIVELPTPNV